MALIFTGSGDVLSEGNTSRYLLPALRWLLPTLSEPALHQLHAVVRKAGHLTEYGVLALLVLRALRRFRGSDSAGWSWRAALLALACCCGYAISDELHQFFVASRYGSAIDVFIDTAGAVLALTAAWLVSRLRRRAAPRPVEAAGRT